MRRLAWYLTSCFSEDKEVFLEGWNGGATILKNQGQTISSGIAIDMFISQYEHAYRFGLVSQQEFEEVKREAHIFGLVTSLIIREMRYTHESLICAIEEMRRSDRRWLPLLADCMEKQDYRPLALKGVTWNE